MSDTTAENDRDAVIQILSRLPADASLDHIRYEFETIFGILESMQYRGPGYSTAEVMERVRQCRLKSAGSRAQATS
jgi:hypothetical protein